MPEYVLAYHTGKIPDTPEEGAKSKAEWDDWLKSLGDAIVNPGTPLKNSTLITSNGVSKESGEKLLTGFTIFMADNMDAAIQTAKGCPYLKMGTIEVAEVIKM